MSECASVSPYETRQQQRRTVVRMIGVADLGKDRVQLIEVSLLQRERERDDGVARRLADHAPAIVHLTRARDRLDREAHFVLGHELGTFEAHDRCRQR